MPFALVFKNAARSQELEHDLIGKLFDAEIAKFTGGAYCHVEAWLEGGSSLARAYSARQPKGTSLSMIDFTDTSLWQIVPVPTTPLEDAELYGYALGGAGRPYNMAGILGIGTDTNLSIAWDRFCSQECFLMIQKVLGMFPQINALHVAPSGKPPGGYGLYELLTGAQK
jgi:hypothetical protein